MILLLLFAFVGGIVTILSPCILPILPVVLSGSLTGGKERPLGIIAGFILSFTFFTLFLTSIVNAFGIPAESLRTLSIIIIFVFGLALIVPQFQKITERFFAKISGLTPKTSSKGFLGGLLVGVSIGLVWTPCVGPILASVISLALTGEVTGSAFFITLAYSLGTAIPMLAIVWGGRNLLNKVPWLLENTGKIQQIFGVLMILTAIAINFNYDRKFQTYILDKFPQYGTGLTSLEDNEIVRERLNQLRTDGEDIEMGKPTFDVMDQANQAPELIPGGEWFNSQPLTLQQLETEDKVVLIDFWTYTCINCIRTLPYLRSWHQKYADDGLVIIGVHTPEFEFEKSADNLSQAIEDYELEYAIVQDNNYETWEAYNNRYWPAKYLIDKNGVVRYRHFGEGAYDRTENMIQELLKESGSDPQENIDNPDYDIESRTPELYLGYGRMQYLANQQSVIPFQVQQFSEPAVIPISSFAFVGDWYIDAEYSNPQEGAELILEFDAKEVFLVMRSVDDEEKEVKIMLDGKELVESQSGTDVDNGIVTVSKDRLYRILELDTPGRHKLELEFIEGEIEIYAFTFG